jgi:hypothetical protein
MVEKVCKKMNFLNFCYLIEMSDPNNLLSYLLPVPIVAKPVCPPVYVGGVPVFIETAVPPFFGTPTQIIYDYAGFNILTRNIPGPYQGILFNDYSN